MKTKSQKLIFEILFSKVSSTVIFYCIFFFCCRFSSELTLKFEICTRAKEHGKCINFVWTMTLQLNAEARSDKLQHTATRCQTLQHATAHCCTLQLTVAHCNTLQHTAAHCNTLQRTATYCHSRQHIATHCNTLQNTAKHCNALQHAVTHQYTSDWADY